MDLKDYLAQSDQTMSEFAEKISRAQSIVSRLVNRKHRPDPSTAVRIVVATKGLVSMDDLYLTPPRFRADRIARQ